MKKQELEKTKAYEQHLTRDVLLDNGFTPPSSKELEMVVLGCIVGNKNTLNKYVAKLNPDIFYFIENKVICKKVLEMYRVGSGIDIITLTQVLMKSGELEMVGGASYIVSLISRIVSTENFEFYLDDLVKKHIRRVVLNICSESMQDAFNDSCDSFKLVSDMQKKLDDAVKDISSDDVEVVRDIHIRSIKETMKSINDGLPNGVKSGLRAVDSLTNGWQKSDLIIIAGRPSMGKTAVAVNMALNSALEYNKPTLVFSLEMSKEQLVGRVQSIVASVDASSIIKKQLTLDEVRTLDNNCSKLYSIPLYIDDTPMLSLIELKSKARRMKSENKIELIVVDYLQLMRSGLNLFNREQEIAEISRGLKALAKELDLPIIALSQLNRGVDARADKVPMLSDLRESGQIEQDADMVVFCYRPEYYGIPTYTMDDGEIDTENLFLLIWAKHRNGSIGEIPLKFTKEFTRVENYDNKPKSQYGAGAESFDKPSISLSKKSNLDHPF